MAVSREQLKKRRLSERELDVDGVGTIRVRALARAEALAFQGQHDVAELEVKMLALALVDPVMTEDDVREWQEAADVGELQKIVDVIIGMSGMEKGVAGESLKQFPQ